MADTNIFGGLKGQGKELKNFTFQLFSSDPTDLEQLGQTLPIPEGFIYYNTVSKSFRYYDGSVWLDIATNEVTSLVLNGSTLELYQNFGTSPVTVSLATLSSGIEISRTAFVHVVTGTPSGVIGDPSKPFSSGDLAVAALESAYPLGDLKLSVVWLSDEFRNTAIAYSFDFVFDLQTFDVTSTGTFVFSYIGSGDRQNWFIGSSNLVGADLPGSASDLFVQGTGNLEIRMQGVGVSVNNLSGMNVGVDTDSAADFTAGYSLPTFQGLKGRDIRAPRFLAESSPVMVGCSSMNIDSFTMRKFIGVGTVGAPLIEGCSDFRLYNFSIVNGFDNEIASVVRECNNLELHDGRISMSSSANCTEPSVWMGAEDEIRIFGVVEILKAPNATYVIDGLVGSRVIVRGTLRIDGPIGPNVEVEGLGNIIRVDLGQKQDLASPVPLEFHVNNFRGNKAFRGPGNLQDGWQGSPLVDVRNPLSATVDILGVNYVHLGEEYNLPNTTFTFDFTDFTRPFLVFDPQAQVFSQIDETKLVPSDWFDYLVLGQAVTADGLTVSDFNIEASVDYSESKYLLKDLCAFFGKLVSGFSPSAPSSPSNVFATSRGVYFSPNIAYNVGGGIGSRSTITKNAEEPTIFLPVYDYQIDPGSIGPQTLVDTVNYNDPNGGLATIPNNKYGVQYLFVGTRGDIKYLAYGREFYDTQSDGLTALSSGLKKWLDAAPDEIDLFFYRGAIVFKQGVTDFTNESDVVFLSADNFGSGGGGSTGAPGMDTRLFASFETPLTSPNITASTALTVDNALDSGGASVTMGKGIPSNGLDIVKLSVTANSIAALSATDTFDLVLKTFPSSSPVPHDVSNGTTVASFSFQAGVAGTVFYPTWEIDVSVSVIAANSKLFIDVDNIAAGLSVNRVKVDVIQDV